MCVALQEIMAPDFKRAEAKGEARGEARGEAKGLAKGKLIGAYETLAGLVTDKILTVAEAAKRAGVSESEFRQNTGITTT